MDIEFKSIARFPLGLTAVVCAVIASFAVNAQQTIPPIHTVIPLGHLHLTDAQRETLRQVRRDLLRDNCDVARRLIDKQEQVRELLSAKVPDQAQLLRAAHELSALQEQLSGVHNIARNRVESLLTAEQRKALYEWRKARPKQPPDQTELLWDYEEPQLYPYPPHNEPSPGWIRRPPPESSRDSLSR